jgi:hypothetical protein
VVVDRARFRKFRCTALTPLWVALLLGLTLHGTAAEKEKIRITGATNEVEIPKESTITPGSELLGGKISAPGEASQGPVVPPPGQPMLIRNPKLDEMIDRKRNWIYESPNSVDRDKAIQEIFGVRDYDLDNFNKRPKTAIERQFESKPEKPGQKTNRTSKDNGTGEGLNGRGELDGTGRYHGPDSLQDRGIIPELNPAYLFNPASLPDPFAQIGGNLGRNSILPPGLGDPLFGQKPGTSGGAQVDQARPELGTLSDINKSPLGRFTDPINDPVDATRTLMNPIAARKPSVPAPESAPSPFSGGFGTAGVSTRPDVFGATSSRFGSPVVYTPPVAPPPSAPVFQPKPAILEIPRPRF